MLITLKNDFLSLTVDSFGAQMMNLKGKDGREYLWQGDPTFWADRAPLLFPVIARQTDEAVLCYGEKYPMKIHGFACSSPFSVAEQTECSLILRLTQTDETKAHYPFDFILDVMYSLVGSEVRIGYRVENRSDRRLPFAIGGHPGFQVGTQPGECFEDYTLTFSECCRPDRVGFTPAVFVSGQDEPYPLKEGKNLPLRHALFDEDAVILKNMARSVTLSSNARPGSLTVSFPDFPYLGLWHWPRTKAPYLCIEPWTSLPARQDVIEELTCKSDMIQLAPGAQWKTEWSIAIEA